MDEYDKKRNANLFISNNANPFLISPYSPNQISQTTGNNILAADIIKSYTPFQTIQVKSDMNITQGVGLYLNNNAVYTNSIYASDTIGGGTTTTIFINPTTAPPTIEVGFLTVPPLPDVQIQLSDNNALFTNTTASYTMTVDGTINTSNINIGQTLNLGPVGPYAGYIILSVNGTPYKLPVYN